MMSKKVIVHNVKGTSNDKCTCSDCNSWLDHWSKKNNGIPVFCATCSCNNQPDVGAHVQRLDNKQIYIIPLCYECNNKNSNLCFEVEENMLIDLKCIS